MQSISNTETGNGSYIPDFTLWIPESNCSVPDLFQGNLDSGFQLLVGFRIPAGVFQIPRPRITGSICQWDSGFLQVYSRFQGPGFRIPIVSGILDSYRCIPDSKAYDSGFPKQQIPRFRIPHAKISRIPLHWATQWT